MNDFASGNRDAWRWTVFMVLPDIVTKKDVSDAVAAAKEKAKFPRFPEVRLEKLSEGLCVQIMHCGPYSAEAPTIQALHSFARERGFALRGRHHEIYLGDPRRAAPEKLKTIIRQPVKKGR
jgi:hypothetical protein